MKKFCTAPEEGREEKINRKPSPKPEKQTSGTQGKPLALQTAINSYSKTLRYVQLLHKHVAQQNTQTHTWSVFWGEDLLSVAASSSQLHHSSMGRRMGIGRWAGNLLVSLHCACMCCDFVARQTSQDCKFPFPASKLQLWLFFSLHLLLLCPSPAHLIHSPLAACSLCSTYAVLSSVRPDSLL